MIDNETRLFIQLRYREARDKKMQLALLCELTLLPIELICDVIGIERIAKEDLPDTMSCHINCGTDKAKGRRRKKRAAAVG